MMKINVETFSEEQISICLYRRFASVLSCLFKSAQHRPSPESRESWEKRKISLAADKTVLVEPLLLLERLTDNPQDTSSPETPRHQHDVGRLIL